MKSVAEKEMARRDKNFAAAVKWFSDGRKIAETLREECDAIRRSEQVGWQLGSDEESKGIKNALGLLEFFSDIMEYPEEYHSAPEEQKELYPGLAYGLLQLCVAVGEMKLNDDTPGGLGWGF